MNKLNSLTAQIQKLYVYPSVSVRHSVVSSSFATPWTAALEAPLSVEFSRQDYCSGQPFSSLGGFSDPEIDPRSPAL